MKAVMLVLTDACNLSCRYCYENKGSNRMSLTEAKKILDSEIKNSMDQSIRVFFFGGEPFLLFETMSQIYDYLAETYQGYDISYAITTNGTLVHGEIQSWLQEHADSFQITLSMDGTSQMHNRNRLYADGRGSFDQIDIDFFRRTFPDCVVKMTIGPDTIQDFAEGIIYIENQGFICKANFASGVDFDLEKNRAVILQNLMRLVDYYSGNDRPLCYMLDLHLESILRPLDEKLRYCSAGTKRHCYYAGDGSWYPCQGLMPMAVGHRGFAGETFQDSCIRNDSLCRTCRWVRICHTCYAMNYSATGDVYKPDPQICYMNRLCMITSARIQYNRAGSSGKKSANLKRAVYLLAKELNGLFV